MIGAVYVRSDRSVPGTGCPGGPDDLQLLLDGQQLSGDPLAWLLVTCNGRGKSLFGSEGHVITMARRRLNNMPTAGFFAAGEFGPIGNRSYLHGHTAVLTLLRPGQQG